MERDNNPKNDDRRAALRKMGAFAAYTAPAMMVMLASKKGQAGGFSPTEDFFDEQV